MKKRIVSMILALSMVLSILPVSAFADAGTSAAAAETTAAGTNEETTNPVVKIKIGADGLPEKQSGTGWSYDSSNNWLTITGVENAKKEYVFDGDASCKVAIATSSNEVYLRDGVVNGQLWIKNPNACVLGGSYAEAVLENGTIDGGTYGKLTENGGSVTGGYFKDISGLQSATQQQAHKLILPEGCTLNGQPVTGDVYMLKRYSEHNLKLEVRYAPGCVAWAAAIGGTSGITSLPVGISNVSLDGCATVSISADGTTISAEVSMFPPLSKSNAPIALTPIPSTDKELSFTGEGTPDVNEVPHVYSLDEGMDQVCVYYGKGWTYTCYPNVASATGQLKLGDQGGKVIDFSQLSAVPINCSVELSNATVTGGIIRQANFRDVTIEGGTFDYLFCAGKCTISKAVAQSFSFDRFGDLAISDTVLCNLSDGNGIENALADGQQLSTLTVRNGGVTAINGRDLPLSVNTLYLVGNASAELTLNTDVLSINDAPVENYNANTSADGKVLRITGKNDGAEIFVNKSTDPSDLKPLRITEKGLPDLTGVTGVPVSGEGMTANLYEGLGWKYATMKENGRTRAALYITTPDGNPVDLASGAINPYHKAIAVEQITFANVTVTGIVAEGSVGAENTIIQDGTFQKDVYADDNSTIAGGTFQDVVRAYGTITGGAFNAVVQLNQNSEVTGGVFHDIQLPSYATEKTVIQNAMILGSLKTDGDSKAAVSNTVSCGYIESKYLAAGQQQSKLMITDGTVKTVKGNAVTADAVYLVGNTAVTLTFSTEVTNINGEDVSAYNGAQLSADGKTLTLTAKNDGEPIVVNMATTGKLPFSSLSKSDFTVSGTIIGPQTVTSSKEGVGKLSLVYVRTYDDRVFETYPAGADMYGLYKQRIVAQEGDKYTEGSLDIGEVVRRYQANRADFEYDSKTQTANYTGPMYFDDAPHYSIQYVPEDGSSPSVTKPTKAGTYSVYIVVNDSDHYYGTQYKVDTYTVTDSKKLPFSSLTKDDFVIDWSTLVPGITCKKEGVGKLSLVCVRTDNNAELDHFPSETEYGSYKIYIEATEGERYTAGRVLITEEPVVRKYWPTRENFSLDLKNGTATYTGPKYFGNVLPQADLVYNTTNDLLTATATVPTEAGTYYVWLVVENSQYYSGRNDLLPDDYTITEKLPFEGFTLDDFHSIENEDGTYTMICTKTDGVGKLTAKFECITGVNKGKIFTNHFTYQVPDAYGRYQITITAEEGTKYKAGSIELGEESLRYTPEAKDFTYDATKNTVEYNGTNYYDADPQMTLLYGTDQSETVPTAPGSYDVYVKVTAGKNYIENARADDDYIIYRVGTYVVPEKYTLTVDDKSTEHVAGEELSFTADEKDGYTFTGWKVTGLPADVDTTKATISFTMPANNVTLKAQYTENAPETYELKVTDAQVTLKDGGAVADLTAVPVGTELVATAAEKDGYTFTGWEVTGLPADVDTTKATISFTMPANKVTLKAQYTENAPKTYKLDVSDATVTLKDGSAVADLKAVPVGTELKATADEDTETSVFKNWSCTGLELTEEQSTARVVYFTMPDHDVNLKAEFVTPTNKLEVTDAQVTLKDGGDVADLTAVPVGTELKATAYEDTETSVFKSWSCTGLELTEEQRTARVVYFTMPDHDVNLKAVFVTPTNKLDVSGAQVTLKDGGAVADLTAVPVDTELKVIADEDTETSVFKNWSCTGLELTEEQSTAHVLEFKMPAQDVKLTAVFEVPATPDPDPTPDPKPDPDPDPEPTPDPKPDPNPDPDPTPDPKPDPTPDPEPTPDPKPNPNPDPTPAPGGDSDGGGAAIVAVAAVGGAAIGAGAYIVGTTAYLKSVLPEGMAIPANRQQLAVALWTAAGKPATQSTALFNDVAADAAELQAIRWVVETGLMTAQDGNFKPGSRVGRLEVIRTWKTYQQRG